MAHQLTSAEWNLFVSCSSPFAQGAGPAAYEAKLLSQDWGIVFDSITYDNLYIWHPGKDYNSPLPMTEHYVKQLSKNHTSKSMRVIHISRFIGTWTRYSQSWSLRAIVDQGYNKTMQTTP